MNYGGIGQNSRGNGKKNLQTEVDGLLEGLDHIFDEMAEYERAERDSISYIDLDIMLKTEIDAAKKQIGRVHSTFHAVTPIQRANAKPSVRIRQEKPGFKDQYPRNPKKIIIAMPPALQREMRAYKNIGGSRLSNMIIRLISW